MPGTGRRSPRPERDRRAGGRRHGRAAAGLAVAVATSVLLVLLGIPAQAQRAARYLAPEDPPTVTTTVSVTETVTTTSRDTVTTTASVTETVTSTAVPTETVTRTVTTTADHTDVVTVHRTVTVTAPPPAPGTVTVTVTATPRSGSTAQVAGVSSGVASTTGGDLAGTGLAFGPHLAWGLALVLLGLVLWVAARRRRGAHQS